MPEAYEGKHRDLATRLAEFKHSDLDTFTIEMFLLSNNLMYRRDMSSRDVLSHDMRAFEMFRASGWNSVSRLRVLLVNKEPTAEAIAQQLFSSAMRQMNKDLVKTFLDAGMNPGSPITHPHFAATSAMVSIAGAEWDMPNTDPLSLLNLLLSYGADIDKACPVVSPIKAAVLQGNVEAIDWFLSNGASITPACLESAAGHISDVDLFARFLNPNTDVDECDSDGRCPLAAAIGFGNIGNINLLLSRGADILLPVELDDGFLGGWTTVLGYACVGGGGEMAVIESLVRSCPDNDVAKDRFSPLALAVQGSKPSYDVIELLLSAGIDVHHADHCSNRTLLVRALTSGNLSLCRLLLSYGAMIEIPLTEPEDRDYTRHDTQFRASALFYAAKHGATDFAMELIMMGERVDDIYSKPPHTVMASAIEEDYLPLIEMLHVAGAPVIGLRVRTIRNIETAVYLERHGLIDDILLNSGSQILAAALASKNIELAHRLLLHNIDLNAPIDDKLQMTPIRAAISGQQFAFIDTLLEQGANITDRELQEAVKYCHSAQDSDRLLRHLLAHFSGRAPNAIGEAIISKRLDFVQLFLASGIDPTRRPQDVNGR
jgi:ankyrin repeat protein